ncbi:MAG: DUF899 family protein [Chitinophagales bacterium]
MNSEIAQLQKELREKQQQLTEARKRLPLEEIKDYELQNKEGEKVMLSALFGESDELLLIHNMGKECTYCTMWADGFRGFTEIITDRMPWVLVSPNEASVLKSFSENRGWNFNVMSFNNSDLGKDLGFEKLHNGKRSFMPGVSALIKKEGKMFRAAYDFFGPGDNYNPAWHFFDLFPNGANGWTPKYIY